MPAARPAAPTHPLQFEVNALGPLRVVHALRPNLQPGSSKARRCMRQGGRWCWRCHGASTAASMLQPCHAVCIVVVPKAARLSQQVLPRCSQLVGCPTCCKHCPFTAHAAAGAHHLQNGQHCSHTGGRQGRQCGLPVSGWDMGSGQRGHCCVAWAVSCCVAWAPACHAMHASRRACFMAWHGHSLACMVHGMPLPMRRKCGTARHGVP